MKITKTVVRFGRLISMSGNMNLRKAAVLKLICHVKRERKKERIKERMKTNKQTKQKQNKNKTKQNKTKTKQNKTNQ